MRIHLARQPFAVEGFQALFQREFRFPQQTGDLAVAPLLTFPLRQFEEIGLVLPAVPPGVDCLVLVAAPDGRQMEFGKAPVQAAGFFSFMLHKPPPHRTEGCRNRRGSLGRSPRR